MSGVMDKVFMAGLVVALILMIIAFEGRGKEIREMEKANKEIEQINKEIEKVNVELQNENTYLKFDGSEVQPCPFCGSSKVELCDTCGRRYYVECRGCYLTTGWCDTVQDAIDA